MLSRRWSRTFTPRRMLRRAFRDMATLRTHVSLRFDHMFEAFARTQLGIA